LGVDELAAPVPPGVLVADDDEDDVSGDAGGVAGLLDDDVVEGGVLGSIDELDDAESEGDVGGLIVDEEDVDGEGVTTGGVVVEVVDDSRLQPAAPSTIPAHTSVINARFIAISTKLTFGMPSSDLADSVPCKDAAIVRGPAEFHREISAVANSLHTGSAHAGRANFIGGR
jgi:hypothetical protein